MHIEVVAKKPAGNRRVWTFYTLMSYNFTVRDADNKLMFCRFREEDKDGNVLASYDTDGEQEKNITRKEAWPSERVKQKALEKFFNSWRVSSTLEEEKRNASRNIDKRLASGKTKEAVSARPRRKTAKRNR